ncbi:MAG: hypothetical protein RMM07_13760, partial [Anaerolineae bacterium]|nr:hypothetical protein [Anaerolineae bacterium]
MLIFIGAGVALALWLLLERTRWGAVIRAGVDDVEMVSAIGINIERVFLGVFILAAVLAGIAGILGGALLGLYPGGSFRHPADQPGSGDCWRHRQPRRRTGGEPPGRVSGSYREIDVPGVGLFHPVCSDGNYPGFPTSGDIGEALMNVRWLSWVSIGLLLFIGILIPYFLPPVYVNLASEILIFGLLAMSIDLLLGYTGLVPLGHAAIFGVAAYVVAYLNVRLGLPHTIVIPAGVISALLISGVFGLLAVRTTGLHFMLITLAEGMLVWGLAYRWTSVTGSENGISGITRPDFLILSWQFYYAVLAIFTLCALILFRIAQSPFGLSLRGIRDNESRMPMLGYNVTLHKFLAFLISGGFAGIAGTLYALYNRFVSPAMVEF